VIPNSLYMEVSGDEKVFYEMWKDVEARIEKITKHQ
jgi:hypothetical protein